jgi:LmbE family N-acetylglucosaminyl deacetylase
MASPDHWQAAQITDAAIFYSRLSKWDEHFDGLPVHRIERHVTYSLMFASDYSGKGSCQFVYDISGVMQRKIEAIRCYATQFPPEKEHVFDRVRTLAATCGLAAGFAAGEVLTSTKPLGSRDLMKTLLLES